MKRATHFAATGVMLRDSSRGRVHGTTLGASFVTYDLDEGDRLRAREGMIVAAELWLRGLGAEFVVPNLYHSAICRSMDEVRTLLPADLPVSRLMGYSSHPQASCSVGRACDADGALRGTEGIYCVDASSLPNNVGRNPQISIMTVARVLGERIARRLGANPRPLWQGPDPLPSPTPQPGAPCGIGPRTR
jgi:choline dehydrogenase-like flavoprotein